MIDWWTLIWIMIPAGVANMVPPIAAKVWPKWETPVDGGKMLWGRRVLGDHKTIRGLVTGVVTAEIIFLLLRPALPWYLGLVLGVGALGGDMLKSFFKRQLGVASGLSWFPWDQIDWIVGTLVVAKLWGLLGTGEVVILIIAGIGLHLLFKVLGFLLRLNQTMI